MIQYGPIAESDRRCSPQNEANAQDAPGPVHTGIYNFLQKRFSSKRSPNAQAGERAVLNDDDLIGSHIKEKCDVPLLQILICSGSSEEGNNAKERSFTTYCVLNKGSKSSREHQPS